MKPRDNAARLQIELRDPDQTLRKLWERVQQVVPEAARARIEDARRDYPEIPFDMDAATNGAIFRSLCEFFLKHHDNQSKPHGHPQEK